MAFVIIPLVWAIDQLTKYIARDKLSRNKSKYYLNETISLRLVDNKGAFLGWLKDKPTYLHLFTLVSLFTILIMGMPYWLSDKGKLTGLGLAFMFAGALGNYTDRLHQGHVTDFVAFKPKHKVHFNIADFAIFKGAILLVLASIFE